MAPRKTAGATRASGAAQDRRARMSTDWTVKPPETKADEGAENCVRSGV